MPATCFTCGDVGHISANCPREEVNDSRPPWCGICDQRTRHLWLNRDGTSVQRCPACHPLRHKTLAQHRRCPDCKTIVYQWDTNSCGQHESPVAPDRRLTLDQIHEIERSHP